MTFKSQEDDIIDIETRSLWDITGKAVKGPMKGTHLAPMVHGNHFWFAWAAFKPNTEVREP